ncbi:hypothetical protein [Joostella sp. CR20]|uniref:hypothetical protein n=1 Tax=Joostella sp. CR20 TaxID=2804312 RepID=UPI00313B8A05
MKLTPEQTAQLYAFTRQHYVEGYDLQTELVDHLANGIEQQWQENPTVTFEEALQTEFKKFGVFGFMEVVEEREKALNKKYLGFIKNQFKSYFSWPEVVKFLSVFSVFFFALYWVEQKATTMLVVLGCVFLWSLFRLFVLQRHFKKRKQENNKKWLLEQQIFNIGGFVSALIMPFNMMLQFRFFELFSWSTLTVLLVSCVLTMYVFLLHIVLYKIPNKAEQYLLEMYPEYAMV